MTSNSRRHPMPGKSSSSGQLSSSPLMAGDCPLHVHAQGRTSLWGGWGDWSFRRREEAKKPSSRVTGDRWKAAQALGLFPSTSFFS